MEKITTKEMEYALYKEYGLDSSLSFDSENDKKLNFKKEGKYVAKLQ